MKRLTLILVLALLILGSGCLCCCCGPSGGSYDTWGQYSAEELGTPQLMPETQAEKAQN